MELRAVALETRADLTLDLGRHRELVGELRELVTEFPVRERLRHQLMLALYRSGRQAEALAAYREFGDLLREEYGIEPGEALQELHRRVLRSDPTLAVAVAEPRTSPNSPASSHRRPRRSRSLSHFRRRPAAVPVDPVRRTATDRRHEAGEDADSALGEQDGHDPRYGARPALLRLPDLAGDPGVRDLAAELAPRGRRRRVSRRHHHRGEHPQRRERGRDLREPRCGVPRSGPHPLARRGGARRPAESRALGAITGNPASARVAPTRSGASAGSTPATCSTTTRRPVRSCNSGGPTFLVPPTTEA
ncbi:AfsR/SARP family transcriptional regulator [Micromonospora sp. M12]